VLSAEAGPMLRDQRMRIGSLLGSLGTKDLIAAAGSAANEETLDLPDAYMATVRFSSVRCPPLASGTPRALTPLCMGTDRRLRPWPSKGLRQLDAERWNLADELWMPLVFCRSLTLALERLLLPRWLLHRRQSRLPQVLRLAAVVPWCLQLWRVRSAELLRDEGQTQLSLEDFSLLCQACPCLWMVSLWLTLALARPSSLNSWPPTV
jgi:hypothetical protein